MTDKLNMVIFENESNKKSFTFDNISLYLNTNVLHESCKAYDFLIIKQNEQLKPYINGCMIK